MKRIFLPLLALAVTACGGLSKQEIAANNKRIAAYEKEIKYAQSMYDSSAKSFRTHLALQNMQMENGYLYFEDVASKRFDEGMKWLHYKTCLKEYNKCY